MPLLRKDLKIGFLAGAVLLVLAVAYALFLTFSGSSTPQQAERDPEPSAATEALPPNQPQGGPSIDPEAPVADSGLLQRTTQAPTDDWSVYITQTPEPGSRDRAATAEPQNPAPDGGFMLPDTTEPASAESAVPLDNAPPDVVLQVRTHEIASGETLSSIAEKYYGDPNLYTLIEKANPKVDSRRLKVGQNLIIPDRPALSGQGPQQSPQPAQQPVPPAGTSGSADAAPSGDPSVYVVQPGDTLALIASRKFGREALWEQIYKLNQDVIGADPAKLKVGMKLKLPQ